MDNLVVTINEALPIVQGSISADPVDLTQQGGVAVHVTHAPKSPTDFLRFEVRDTGIGIPLENQRHLFQEFYQVQGDCHAKAEGSGLGLAISRRLVEVMGGSIGVQSREGEGSTFWFELPLPPTTHVSVPTPDRQLAEPGSVLVAEDLPMNQTIIAEMLEGRPSCPGC